jgi:hypothetical protein
MIVGNDTMLVSGTTASKLVPTKRRYEHDQAQANRSPEVTTPTRPR